jgi:SAP domain-containing ribonucleoprotein
VYHFSRAKMPEYAKMKNADLEGLLKARGLPTGGKKADMVDRLTKDDEEKKSTEPADAPAPAAKPIAAEDEIDWDDDEEAAPAAKPAPVAAAKTAGATETNTSQAVPNQTTDSDLVETDDIAAKEAGEQVEDAEGEIQAEESKEPPKDYSRGLAASNIEEEIEKRKKRAAKFGLNIEEDEGYKKLVRAQKFGETGPPKGLDEALPERPRKRGRDNNDEGSRGNDKRRGGGRFGGRRGGRGPRDGDRRRDDRNGREEKSRSNNGPSSWLSDADRAKAEARKAKWNTPAAAS